MQQQQQHQQGCHCLSRTALLLPGCSLPSLLCAIFLHWREGQGKGEGEEEVEERGEERGGLKATSEKRRETESGLELGGQGSARLTLSQVDTDGPIIDSHATQADNVCEDPVLGLCPDIVGDFQTGKKTRADAWAGCIKDNKADSQAARGVTGREIAAPGGRNESERDRLDEVGEEDIVDVAGGEELRGSFGAGGGGMTGEEREAARQKLGEARRQAEARIVEAHAALLLAALAQNR